MSPFTKRLFYARTKSSSCIISFNPHASPVFRMSLKTYSEVVWKPDLSVVTGLAATASPPGSQWIRPHCPLHTYSSALCTLLGALRHMPPPWVLAMFPLFEKGLPMKGGFWNKFPEASARSPHPSLGPQVRYSWLVNQATQWEGLHSRFWFFIVSTASVICKDNAYSDICNNTMITISNKSLYALEILCFIDSFFHSFLGAQ